MALDLVPDRDVALVHDYLLVLRGAERTFDAMAACWPTAPIHTLLYDPHATEHRFAGHPVHTSPLQRTGIRQEGFRRLLPLFPGAAARLDLGDARVVVSSSSAFAHGVPAPAGAVHVCYCHSPFRYVWHERERALTEFLVPARPAASLLLDRVRAWDHAASQRVTHYIANSRLTQQRIADFYGREAPIIHPPVAVDRFHVGTPEDFFLIVGELVAHKNVDVALEAAERAGVHVKVVGRGPELERLQARFAQTADFLGRVDDAELEDLYARCRALLMPAVEEFGIAAVEALASGRPVVAADRGGALEFVTPSTGILTPVRDVDALAEVLAYTDFESFDPRHIRRHAERFSTERFQLLLADEVGRIAAERPEPVTTAPVRTGRFRRRTPATAPAGTR